MNIGKIKDGKSPGFVNKWKNHSLQDSLAKIKLTLDEDLVKEKSLLDQVTEAFNTLILLAPNDETKEQLKIRFVSKGFTFKQVAL